MIPRHRQSAAAKADETHAAESLYGQLETCAGIKKRKPERLPPDDFGGMDETRTRDLLRDRQAF